MEEGTVWGSVGVEARLFEIMKQMLTSMLNLSILSLIFIKGLCTS